MTVRYDEVIGPLREAYDRGAAWRDGVSKEPWRLAERQAFGELLPGARLLEIGADTGQDSAYFQAEGLRRGSGRPLAGYGTPDDVVAARALIFLGPAPEASGRTGQIRAARAEWWRRAQPAR
jgi:hypothetical protein